MLNIRLLLSLYILFSCFYAGTIQGIIKDKRTKQPLIGANVMLKKTQIEV